MQNNIIDWSEDFDGVGRMLRSSRRSSGSSCTVNGEPVDCDDAVPGWVVGVAIGVILIIVGIILVCVATKKCKKKFKCARIIKCCKKNASAEA